MRELMLELYNKLAETDPGLLDIKDDPKLFEEILDAMETASVQFLESNFETILKLAFYEMETEEDSYEIDDDDSDIIEEMTEGR